MRILVLGEGSRFIEIARFLAKSKQKLFVYSQDRHSSELLAREGVYCREHKPQEELFPGIRNVRPNDLILLSYERMDLLTQVLEVLTEKKLIQLAVGFGMQSGALSGKIPSVDFRHEEDLYGQEALKVIRKALTLRKADDLRRIGEKAQKILLLIYGNPDPDAVAGGLALRYFLKRTNETMTMAYTGKIGRPENQAMIHSLRIPIEKFDTAMLDTHDCVATVDAQPSFFKFDHPVDFKIVIDHHPKGAEVKAEFVDIDTGAGSTTSMLTRYFLETGEKIPKKLATALLYGLTVDTQNFQRIASDEDIRAFRNLRPLANVELIREIEFSQFFAETLDFFAVALQKRRSFRDILYSHLGTLPSADICVQVADFFKRVNEVNWAIVSGLTEDSLIVVFRTRAGGRRGAGKVAEDAFDEIGSAGGHKEMARAEVPLEKAQELAGGLSEKAIENFVLHRLSKDLKVLKRYSKPPALAAKK